MARPEISVVVAGSRPEHGWRRIAAALALPLASGQAEMIVATGRTDASDLPRGARLAQCPPGTTVPRLRAAGWASARGEVVALTEDFCLPFPDWAGALLAAHHRHAAVAVGGPVTRRAGEASEWALTFCEYGRFFDPEREGPVDDLPGINVSYKADALRRLLGGELPGEIQEVVLHGEIRQHGGALWREPRAVMEDVSRVPLAAAARSIYHHGRLYGGQRLAGRPVVERMLRAGLAPAIPLVLAARILREVLPAGYGGEALRAGPSLGLLLAAWAMGEGIGALAGPGDSARRWR